MFGWRRKRDGFEWHEYVRTTILMRRARRRQKLDAAREAAIQGLKEAGVAAVDGVRVAGDAAAAGLKQAGVKGRAAGAAGVEAAAAGIGHAGAVGASWLSRSVHWLSQAARLLAHAPGWIAERLVPLAAGLAGAAARGAQPVASWLARPRLVVGLGVTGVAALLGAATRIAVVGTDATSVTLSLFGVLLLTAAALPTLYGIEVETTWAAVTGRASRASRQGDAAPQLNNLARIAGWGTFVAIAVLGLGHLLSPPQSEPVSLARQADIPRPTRARAAEAKKIAADGGRVSGHAVALTGDTLRLGRQRIHLDGIEAPAPGQRCQRANGRSWRCDTAAKSALAKELRRQSVSCEVTGRIDSGTSKARCTRNGKDIAEALVRSGSVFAEAGFFAPYTGVEDEARGAERGIWAGKPQRPGEYRAARWEAAQQRAPDGCPIKGQVSGRERTYLLPWYDGYERVEVKEARGGRWFCSEEEAKEAGWKPAQRS